MNFKQKLTNENNNDDKQVWKKVKALLANFFDRIQFHTHYLTKYQVLLVKYFDIKFYCQNIIWYNKNVWCNIVNVKIFVSGKIIV